MDLPERTCICGCGDSFKPVRKGQKFLNREHRWAYHNARKLTEDTVCPHCGKKILEQNKSI